MSYPVFYIPAGDILPVLFSSYAGGTGASITLTGLAVTDIEIYKDGSTTQRASDAGYTLLDTDGIDFDGITGIHGFSIDTGDNTDAGFYTVGAWFTVVVSAVTVDSQTVNFIACQFRIMPAEVIAGKPKVDVDAWLGTAASTPTVAGVPNVNVKTWNDLTTVALPLIPTTAGRTLDVTATGEAGVDWANVGSPTTTLALTGTTIATTQKVDVETIKTNPVVNAGTITFPTGATLASTTNITAGTITTVTTVTNQLTAAVIATGIWQDATAGDFTTASSIGKSLYTSGVVPGGTNGLFIAGTNAATVVTTSLTTTFTGNVTGSVASVTGAVGSVTGAVGSVATGGIVAASFGAGAIDAAAIAANAIGASELAADAVTEIQAGLSTLDAAAVRTAVGLASANLDTQLSAIDDFLDTEVAAILAAVDTEVAAIKAKTDNLPSDPTDASDVAASFTTVNSTLTTIASYLDTEIAAIKVITDALGATAAARLSLSAGQIIPGTVDTGSFAATTTIFEADDITEATADHYNGRVIIFTSGALSGQATTISDYVLSGSNGRFTVVALTETPTNNGTFIIV